MTKTIKREETQFLDYEENYDLIAWLHIEHGSNPWMNLEDIAAYATSTINLVNEFMEEGSKLLDAGCGIGEMLLRLDEDIYDITGFDLSQDYLDNFLVHKRKAKLVQGRIEAMPFPDESFDAVICTDVLEHVLHLDDAVRELLRVLKRDGCLFVRVPVEADLTPYLPDNNPFRYVHLRRFAEPDLILLFDRCFECSVERVERVAAVVAAGSEDINVVVRKP